MAKKQKIVAGESTWYGLALARILIGIICLWAFFDKLFGLGVSTPINKAWVSGVSPTMGFLKGVQGPFEGIFHPLASQGWTDALFMIGLFGIGVGLIAGVAMRLSTIFGGILFFLMWMASLPIKTNPLIDEHLIYIAVLIALYGGLAQQKWSLAGWWQETTFVKKMPWLR